MAKKAQKKLLPGVYWICENTIEKGTITGQKYIKGEKYHDSDYRYLSSRERLNFKEIPN